MGITRRVMERKGIFQMAQRLGFEAIPLEEIPRENWEHFPLKESYWSRGVEMPIRRVVELKLGAKSVQEIALIAADDEASREFASKVQAVLNR